MDPYEELILGGKTYYFAPGGFLYRKDRGAEAAMLWVRVNIGDRLEAKHAADCYGGKRFVGSALLPVRLLRG